MEIENAAEKMELIDKLAELVNCFYLSDLALPQHRERLREALGTIMPQDYTLEDWNNAAKYLTHGHEAFFDGAEVQKYLLKVL